MDYQTIRYELHDSFATLAINRRGQFTRVTDLDGHFALATGRQVRASGAQASAGTREALRGFVRKRKPVFGERGSV